MTNVNQWQSWWLDSARDLKRIQDGTMWNQGSTDQSEERTDITGRKALEKLVITDQNRKRLYACHNSGVIDYGSQKNLASIEFYEALKEGSYSERVKEDLLSAGHALRDVRREQRLGSGGLVNLDMVMTQQIGNKETLSQSYHQDELEGLAGMEDSVIADTIVRNLVRHYMKAIGEFTLTVKYL